MFFLKHFEGIAFRMSFRVKGGSAPKSKGALSIGFGTQEREGAQTNVGHDIRSVWLGYSSMLRKLPWKATIGQHNILNANTNKNLGRKHIQLIN